jgi:hypothetical protein
VTSFGDGLIAFILFALLNVFILSRIGATAAPTERPFLLRVYRWTLFLRVILALFLNVYSGETSFADMFWGDSSTYDWGGSILAMKWEGTPVVLPPVLASASGYGFYYVVGFIYYVFGRNQLLVQLLNGTLGSLTVLVIYAIARRLFDVEVARWSARFTAFFPAMVFWSGAMYKDPAIQFCIAVCIYCVLRLNEKFALKFLVFFIAAALALMTFRFYVCYIVVITTLSTFLLTQRRGILESFFVQIIFVGLFLGAFAFGVSRERLDQQRSLMNVGRITITREDQANLGQSAYGVGFDVSTPAGALAALPVGVTYLLFAPFPWAIRGVRQLLTLPEMLVWYWLMPSLVRGLRYTFRTKFRQSLPILAFTTALTLTYALSQGNVGTAYRQRTQITMFFFIFMGAGLVEKQRRQALPAPPRNAWAATVPARR